MADIPLIVPQLPPKGLVNTSSSVRKGIDSTERLYVGNVRTLEKAAIYLAGAQKLSPGFFAGRWIITKGNTERRDIRIPRTVYTKYGMFTFVYGTAISLLTLAATGTIKVTTSTGGLQFTLNVQETVLDTPTLELPGLFVVQRVVVMGAGNNADTGYEDIEVEVANTSSGATGIGDIIVFSFGVIPQGMQTIGVPNI